jgi:colanic acid/amylovoran biosynthesis glycosyltransferase
MLVTLPPIPVSRVPVANLQIQATIAYLAYLASEIPVLSATFVLEELFRFERGGFRVMPILVRASAVPTIDQKRARAERVSSLYAGLNIQLILAGVASVLSFGRSALIALKYLVSDILEFGPYLLASWKFAYEFLAATELGHILKRKNL